MVRVVHVWAVEVEKKKNVKAYNCPYFKAKSSDVSRHLSEIRRAGSSGDYLTLRTELNDGQMIDVECPLKKLERALGKKKTNVYIYIEPNSAEMAGIRASRQPQRAEGHWIDKKEVKTVIDTAHIRDGMIAKAEAAGRSFERAVEKKTANMNINFDTKDLAERHVKAVDNFATVCYKAIWQTLVTVVLCQSIAAFAYVKAHQYMYSG